MIELNDTAKKKLKKLERAGLMEWQAFKAEVINSNLENPTKFYLYDIIDKRISNLSIENAMIENESPYTSWL